jgi:hypothetical protein
LKNDFVDHRLIVNRTETNIVREICREHPRLGCPHGFFRSGIKLGALRPYSDYPASLELAHPDFPGQFLFLLGRMLSLGNLRRINIMERVVELPSSTLS